MFKISTRQNEVSKSSKHLSDKIKSLHLSQFLTETKDDSIISLVEESLFKDQVIDLSNQTLLPRDLSTLVFFLIRSQSRNKNWKMLNLCRCYMGTNGCRTLLEGLVKHGTHANIHIDKVNLSYNQLTLKSLVSLFPLIKGWHTSEIIITNTDMLDITTSSRIFTKIENAFVLSNDSALQKFSVGSFLFAHKPNRILMPELCFHMKSLYLLQCDISKDFFSICNQLVDIHILDSHLSENVLGILTNMLSSSKKIASLFLYDSTLSDKKADKIGKLIATKFSSGVKLLVSKTKVLGILNTTSIFDALSNLEILNLTNKLRCQFSNSRELVTPWRNDLCFYGNKNKAVYQNFVCLLLSFKINFELKLVEGNTLIAHKIISKGIMNDNKQILKAVYLSDCDLSDAEYESIVTNGEPSLSILYILHSSLKLEILHIPLSNYIFALQEVFLHTKCFCRKESLCSLLSTTPITSAVIVTKDTLVLHNPTSKQLSLALQLEPSVTVCVLLKCMLEVDTFYAILYMLAALNKNWVEVEFKHCFIRNVECEVAHEYLKMVISFQVSKN